ncbi:adenosylcobinamide amidohydrolase [Candidatus Bathyarchaeota archaeon]|nr:adenosylcobinamide amidohydrolase [Candidatus Bathyarchaeota archaeon]
MKIIPLSGENLKLLYAKDYLALTSKNELSVISSAIHNGGFKKAKAILNVHVSEEQDMLALHQNPTKPVLKAIENLELSPEATVGMITAADVTKFSLKTMELNGLRVSAIATAGCSFAETAGENIEAKVSNNRAGTINIIIAIEGNPTESCMMQNFIAATEAKTAALRELDIRSRYSGDPATGTVTDSLAIVATNVGPLIRYGGPASKLGKLVSQCTRSAVKEAALKNGALSPARSLFQRFCERKIPLNKLLREILETKIATINLEELNMKLKATIDKKPFLALVLMMAAKMDEDIKYGLIPKEFGDLNLLKEEFKTSLHKALETKATIKNNSSTKDYPFLKSALQCIIEEILSK